MGLGQLYLRSMATLVPIREIEPSEDLIYALSFIESSTDPQTVIRAGYGTGVVVLIASLGLVATPLPIPTYLIGIIAVSLSLLSIQAVHSWPELLAAFQKTRALGDTPNLIGRIVLRMEIQPATEAAVQFAADTGFGPLAESLEAHIDKSMGTPKTGLLTFADEWSDDFPALRRSASLLSTAENAPGGERARTLDRALSAILDGTREQMADFLDRIQAPTTALYAFGVMLPLAVVALFPAASLVDIRVPLWVFVVVYNLILPLVLVGASVWLLVRRPVAFPPPQVDRSHPEVAEYDRLPLIAGIGAAAVGIVATFLLGVAYLAPISGFGFGLGVFLFLFFRPVKEIRDYVRAVEEHITDALYLVGRQVAEGEAVESAIAQAAEQVPGETRDVFQQASGLQQRLHVGVNESFMGEYGALNGIPSVRARGMAALLSIAADEGRPAGRAIVSMADHLEELQEVESEAKRQLSTVTGTLDSTAKFFGPLVAGTVVALSSRIISADAIDTFNADPISIGPLGLAVGVYVITMSVILTTLSIGLRNGLDRSLVGYEVGRTLLISVPLYVVVVAAVGIVV